MPENPETTAPRPVYCPYRGGLKQICETPNACAGGADCRRGIDPTVPQATIRSSVALIERAKEIDPPAWRDTSGDAAYRRRMASIHQAAREAESNAGRD